MKIGYVRVSTVEQNLARQLELMKTLGVEKGFLIRKIKVTDLLYNYHSTFLKIRMIIID